MNECAVLDSLSGEAFQGCEEFEEWTTYDSGHWNEAQKQHSCFDEWSCFHDGVSQKEQTAHISPQNSQMSCQEYKVEDSCFNPWFVFNNCFSDEEAVKDKVMVEISPLSHLIHGLHHRMLFEPEAQMLSHSKPSLHSQKQLISTLQLEQPDPHSPQNLDFPDLGFEEPENSCGALIQTKLEAPLQSQKAPGFFYQISRQWISQTLLLHQDKKDLQQKNEAHHACNLYH